MLDMPPNTRITTWDLYKSHLVRTQITILVVTILVFFVLRPHIAVLVSIYVLLQIMSVLGVWWGLRTARRIASKEEKLPLQDR